MTATVSKSETVPGLRMNHSMSVSSIHTVLIPPWKIFLGLIYYTPGKMQSCVHIRTITENDTG